MLKIQNLKAGYKSLEILHGIELEVKPAEIVAIIGPNGSGKSTLLKSIFNLCEIYSGKIIFKNKDITKLPTHYLIQEGICYVPQGRQVFSTLTVRENLEMGCFILEDHELFKRNLADVYNKFPVLKKRENDLALNLSGGEQQMLAIARALMTEPRILILDEPTLGLSPKVSGMVIKTIEKLREDLGVSILLIEEKIKLVLSIADRIYIMNQGEIIYETSKANYFKDEDIFKKFVGL